MREYESVDDLHSRAVALLRGPCCISKEEGSPPAVELIRRYVDGESWDADLLSQLSRCLRKAQELAREPEAATGPERDARFFYQKAAAIREEIQAKVAGGRV